MRLRSEGDNHSNDRQGQNRQGHDKRHRIPAGEGDAQLFALQLQGFTRQIFRVEDQLPETSRFACKLQCATAAQG